MQTMKRNCEVSLKTERKGRPKTKRNKQQKKS